jgi:hypothetical protein
MEGVPRAPDWRSRSNQPPRTAPAPTPTRPLRAKMEPHMPSERCSAAPTKSPPPQESQREEGGDRHEDSKQDGR